MLQHRTYAVVDIARRLGIGNLVMVDVQGLVKTADEEPYRSGYQGEKYPRVFFRTLAEKFRFHKIWLNHFFCVMPRF